jgi:multimeric flavodoxin WrbA
MRYDEMPMHNARERRRRLLVFNGSPRGVEGNTHAMVAPFLEGALAEDAATEYVVLAEHDIRPCTAC